MPAGEEAIGKARERERVGGLRHPVNHKPLAAREAVLIKVRRDRVEFFIVARKLSPVQSGFSSGKPRQEGVAAECRELKNKGGKLFA